MTRKLTLYTIFFLLSFQLLANYKTIPSDSIKVSAKDSVNYSPLKNSIFIEFGGIASFYSLNYERLIYSKEGTHLSLRMAGSYLPIAMSAYSSCAFVANLKRNLNSKLYFNAGIGLLFWNDRNFSSVGSTSDQGSLKHGEQLALTIGLEYRPIKMLFLKLSITPKVDDDSWRSFSTLVFIGTSVGFSF